MIVQWPQGKQRSKFIIYPKVPFSKFYGPCVTNISINFLFDCNSIWSGPNNPRGSYSFPTHYSDGTSIYDEDFSENPYPNNGTSSKSETRLWYSEKSYFTMVRPSMACSSTVLPENINVWRHTDKGEHGSNSRSVVCKGNNN